MDILDTLTYKLQPNKEKKKEKSHPFFQDTKVSSCAYIKINNNIPQAIPYYQRPYLSYADKITPSSETKSMSSYFYEIQPDVHLGMNKKPLSRYNPDAYRSRLPIDELKFPANNASSIIIGDRAQINTRQYLSESQNVYGKFGKINFFSNPGIQASNTKWIHSRQKL